MMPLPDEVVSLLTHYYEPGDVITDLEVEWRVDAEPRVRSISYLPLGNESDWPCLICSENHHNLPCPRMRVT